jgi:hypothetical protein
MRLLSVKEVYLASMAASFWKSAHMSNISGKNTLLPLEMAAHQCRRSSRRWVKSNHPVQQSSWSLSDRWCSPARTSIVEKESRYPVTLISRMRTCVPTSSCSKSFHRITRSKAATPSTVACRQRQLSSKNQRAIIIVAPDAAAAAPLAPSCCT